jgi:HlyD family secretion protein
MTLSGDIHIGTRSILMYIVSGALQGMGEAMREP